MNEYDWLYLLLVFSIALNIMGIFVTEHLARKARYYQTEYCYYLDKSVEWRDNAYTLSDQLDEARAKLGGLTNSLCGVADRVEETFEEEGEDITESLAAAKVAFGEAKTIEEGREMVRAANREAAAIDATIAKMEEAEGAASS
jgi:hypothetical protein